MPTATKVMPKKQKPGKPIAVRFPQELVDALETAADLHNTDVSNLLRMMVSKHVGQWLEEGRKAMEDRRRQLGKR